MKEFTRDQVINEIFCVAPLNLKLRVYKNRYIHKILKEETVESIISDNGYRKSGNNYVKK